MRSIKCLILDGHSPAEPYGIRKQLMCALPLVQVRLWDLLIAQQVALCSGHEGAVHHIAWHRSQAMLSSCGEDGTVSHAVWLADCRAFKLGQLA
jgi:WD40 repeat protein